MSKAPIKTIRELAKKESESKELVRSAQRQSDLGEVFTPTPLVIEMLRKLPAGKKGVWKEDKTFLDPACGNGQFLAVILIIKLQFGHDPEKALSTIYGVDIMADNVKECRERLWKIAVGEIENRSFKRRCLNIVKKNIVKADGLKYDYSFGEKER